MGPLTRRQWRSWLRKHHDVESEVWLVFAKRSSGKKSLRYAEAVEEALCFGWIDTTVRRLDEHHYTQRFTPRANRRKWSQINLDRFARMEAEGLMTDAGRAKRPADVTPPAPRLESGGPVPEFVRKALAKDAAAAEFFDKLAPSYRRDYLRWITEAKKQETRERRLEAALRLLRRKVKRVYDLRWQFPPRAV
jgi:uncharacterized protein YdeI (YjbR/CyaY-like superfamily)